MSRRPFSAIFVVVFLLGVVHECAGADFWPFHYLKSWRQSGRCIFSGRQLHSGMQVAVQRENDKTSGIACCLRCVITEAEHTGISIRVLWVSDYVTHERIRPDRAIYVVGSTIHPDSGPPVEVPWTRRERSELTWDRCLPSVIAFSKRDEALKFQQMAGGDIQTFSDLVAGTNVTRSYHPEMP